MENLLSGLLGNELDERFVIHRYRASRLSLLVGVLLLSGWFLYEFFANEVMHVEIMGILAAMALTKLAAMAYYRRTG